MLADCSMPVLQPQEMRCRRELPDELTAPAASGCRQNEDDDERRHLMSATDLIQIGELEDTDGTKFYCPPHVFADSI